MHTDTEQSSTTTPKAATTSASNQAALAANAPGQLRVIKRNGTVVPYHDDKIIVAMTKAFLAVEGGNAAASSRVHETVEKLTNQISSTFRRRMPSGGTIHIEEIQDQVELILMRSGDHKVARDYVIYRTERAKLREAQRNLSRAEVNYPSINVKQLDGSYAPLEIDRLNTLVAEACSGLTHTDPSAILKEAMRNLYDGVTEDDVNTALVISARTLVEREPEYTYATSRLLLDKLRCEALRFLGVAQKATQTEMGKYYA